MSNYVCLDFEVRQKLQITMMEYALMERIYFLSHNKANIHNGWCWASRQTLADDIGYTKRGIIKAIDRLAELGLIEKNDRKWVAPTILYHRIAHEKTGELKPQSVNSVHQSGMSNGELSTPQSVNSVHQSGELSSPKYIDINKDIKEEKIKLHSPQSSEEDFQGETQEDFSSQKGQEEIQVEEKKNTNPYQLTDSDMNLLKSYQKGFIEEIDKVAKVKYDKKLIHLCKTFNLLNKDRELLKAIYIYFRTYRDHFGTYTTEIRSFKALNEKIEKLQAEMIRETKRVIKESGSVVLHQDKEKKIAVIYKSDSMKKDDKNRIDDFKRIGYTVFDMYKTIGHIELKDLGYHVQHVY
jgi:hypothetical protein